MIITTSVPKYRISLGKSWELRKFFVVLILLTIGMILQVYPLGEMLMFSLEYLLRIAEKDVT